MNKSIVNSYEKFPKAKTAIVWFFYKLPNLSSVFRPCGIQPRTYRSPFHLRLECGIHTIINRSNMFLNFPGHHYALIDDF